MYSNDVFPSVISIEKPQRPREVCKPLQCRLKATWTRSGEVIFLRSCFCFSTFQTAFSEALVFDHDISLWVYSRKPLYQQGTTSGVYYNKDHQDGLSQQLHRKPAVLLGGTMNKDTKEPSEKVLLRRKSATPTVAGFGEKGLNEIEENGDGGESRGGEQ